MSLATNVVRIAGRYYFRCRIPEDIKPYLKRQAYKIALRTAEPSSARRKAAIVSRHMLMFFDEIRMSDKSEKEQLEAKLEEMLDEKHKGLAKILAQKIIIDEYSAEMQLRIVEMKNLDLYLQNVLQDAELRRQTYYSNQKSRKLEKVGDDLKYEKRKLKEIEDGKLDIKKRNPEANQKLMYFVDKVEKNKKGKILDHSLPQYRRAVSLFTGLVGDKPVHEYKLSDFEEYQSLFLRVPLDYQKIASGNPLKAIEVNDNLPDGQKYDTYKWKTFKGKHASSIRVVFDYIKKHKILEYNPMSDFKLEEPVYDYTATRRKPKRSFKNEELVKIFNVPLFHSCLNSVNWMTPGNYPIRDFKFWGILIGLFTGARSSEIGQLLIMDVVNYNNIPHFHIVDQYTYEDVLDYDLNISEEELDEINKRTKNKKSVRLVPVHNELIKMGFLDYLEKRKSECQSHSEQLFPDWYADKYGRHSTLMAERFSYLLDKSGIKTQAISFHSFRHTFKDAMRRADLPYGVQRKFMGHSLNDVNEEYGIDKLQKKHSEEINNISYDTLDFSHLYVK
ncbi:site-specific integrase [Thalassospira profundimaris]|nr:site-specific integrase [Thalassospira profundimaris]